MMWGKWNQARQVINELWSKARSLGLAMEKNSSADYYTRVIISGIGMLIVVACLVVKMSKMRELLNRATWGWNSNNQGGNTIALPHLGVRL